MYSAKDGAEGAAMYGGMNLLSSRANAWRRIAAKSTKKAAGMNPAARNVSNVAEFAKISAAPVFAEFLRIQLRWARAAYAAAALTPGTNGSRYLQRTGF